MDTHNDDIMATDRMRAEIAGKKLAVGAKQLRKAVVSGKARRVYLACNADPAITEPLVALCRRYQIGFSWVRNMTELGSACGIEVGAAAAVAVD